MMAFPRHRSIVHLRREWKRVRAVIPVCYLSSDGSSNCKKRPNKVAIVGSGPSGMYTAKYLKATWDKQQKGGGGEDAHRIDVLERLPTPYGLVRFGVAPDHPEVKNVQHDFDALFQSATDNDNNSCHIHYFGNVHVGQDVSLQELRERYDAVVLATGCESDRRLGLPNEDHLSGILSAREFVAWYNGHPDFVHIGDKVREALLTQGGTPREDVSVVVVGHGNVAFDCARILVKGAKGLYHTDMASHALPILGDGVKRVTVVGRRGHIQGAFTIKELRELVNLHKEGHDTAFVVREEELEMGATESSKAELQGPSGRPKQRIDKLLHKALATPKPVEASKQIDLRFLMSPSSWEPDENDPSKLGALVCERTRLEGEPRQQQAIGTGEMERIPAQLALLSIGYMGAPLPGISNDQFDFDRGIVKHVGGRIEAPSLELGGLYASGWLKRGPSGIIGTNIPDARDTVASVLQDLETLESFKNKERRKEPGLDLLLEERGVRTVNWESYRKIEHQEELMKRSDSQPREKITDLEEMVRAALAEN